MTTPVSIMELDLGPTLNGTEAIQRARRGIDLDGKPIAWEVWKPRLDRLCFYGPFDGGWNQVKKPLYEFLVLTGRLHEKNAAKLRLPTPQETCQDWINLEFGIGEELEEHVDDLGRHEGSHAPDVPDAVALTAPDAGGGECPKV